MKCHVCRQRDVELLSGWERLRYWLFIRFNSILFPQDLDDLKSEKYTQGISDGHLAGYKSAINKYEKDIALYDL